jgi:hypothetical protein
MRKFAFVVFGWLAHFFGSQLLRKIVEPYDYSDSTIGTLYIVYFFISVTLLILLYRRLFSKTRSKQSSRTGFTYRPPASLKDVQPPILAASVKFLWSNGFVHREPAKGSIKLFYSTSGNSIMFDWTLQSRTLRSRVGETVATVNLSVVESTNNTITIEYQNPDDSTTTLEIISLSDFDHSRMSAAFKDSRKNP